MDASRSDPAYLYEVIEAVIAAGAGTINIPTRSATRCRKSLVGSFGAFVSRCQTVHKR